MNEATNVLAYRLLSKVMKERNPTFPFGDEVTISAGLLTFLLKGALAQTKFDEDYYVKSNPDVRQALSLGKLSSAREHFINEGYWEGRKPFEVNVDEKWYLQQNPDVAQAMRSGMVGSAADHYQSTGWQELRAPNADAATAISEWIVTVRGEVNPAADSRLKKK